MGKMVSMARTPCRKPAPHCAVKPAPPSSGDFVNHSFSCMSSAMETFQGWRARISRWIHCSSDQPSGMSSPQPPMLRGQGWHIGLDWKSLREGGTISSCST
jgi:hypothetical protein